MGARGGRSSQDGVFQPQEAAPLRFRQLDRLHETLIVRGEDASNVPVTPIPAQCRVTQQIIRHWQPFHDLKQTFAVSLSAEKLRLRSQQRVLATTKLLRKELGDLELQEAWSSNLWQTFFSMTVGRVRRSPPVVAMPLSAWMQKKCDRCL